MKLANETAAMAVRALEKATAELKADGPWRWQCVAQNGAPLAFTASLEEGFLRLSSTSETNGSSVRAPMDLLLGNSSLPGGVRFALDPAGRGIHMRTDITVLDEESVRHRINWALRGFCAGFRWLKSRDLNGEEEAQGTPNVECAALGDLLRETSWTCVERGPNDFSAALDCDSVPAARIRLADQGVLCDVEIARRANPAIHCRQALAVFLVTASDALRLVRGCAAEADGQLSVGFQVCLAAAPASEEIAHALAALSVACQSCGREVNVLFDGAVARSYLAAREFETTNHETQ